ncbi:MAG TPA: transcriptional regulator [Vicinamibacterales bacterium]|jgi:DNA-binding MarR family transcriptional regulator|nr:transcriptional regulator [Vicinamibacterales bacterium]
MAAKRSAAAARVDPPEVQRTVRAPAAATATRAAGLDRLVHDRTRLAIVTALSVNASLSFTELKGITQTTDGNLSVHARKLEEAGYVLCTKGFEGRLPKTEFSLTDAGRRAFKKYLDHMEAIIQHARGKK